MIEIRNISHSFTSKQVLKDVSLTIEENKITGLIGANGAGKSTLFSVIANLVKPQSGEVLLDGKEVKDIQISNLAKEVSILRQSNHIGIRITVRELVEYGRFPHSRGRLTNHDQDKINEAIRYMSLEDIQDKYIDSISGGQRQRAYIAMIIAQDTKYILLDEPLNNLDMRYTTEMMRILRALVDELGKTIVIVLHDINCAATYCDKIVAMKDGKLIKEGTALEIINKEVLDELYEHDFNIIEINEKRLCLYE